MAWIKVPPEHHPLFHAALPADRRVSTMQMFGGVAAKVNGHIFAGLFGRSVMLALPEPERSEALALEGAGPFDPMGDGRVRSQKVMLPEAFMDDAPELSSWIARAFAAAAALPPKRKGPIGATKGKAQPRAAAKVRTKAKAAPAAKARKAAAAKAKPRAAANARTKAKAAPTARAKARAGAKR
ncbi:MAG: TfoX/Sxy family protein [Kofleriaceae bacterium]